MSAVTKVAGVRAAWVVVAVAAALFVAAATANAHASTVGTVRWLQVLIDDAPCGWRSETSGLNAEGNHETASETRLSIRRAGTVSVVHIIQRFVESESGQPLEAETIDVGSGVRTHWRFHDRTVVTETIGGAGDAERVRRRTLSTDEWLSPRGVDALVMSRIEAGATSFRYAAVDQSVGIEPIIVSMKLLGREPVEIDGASQAAQQWQMTSSAMPGIVNIIDIDPTSGRRIRERGRLPIGELAMIPTTEGVARAAIDAANLPEVLVASFTKADRAIPNPRSLRRVVLRVAAPEHATPGTSVVQSVKPDPETPGSHLVTIDLDRSEAARSTDQSSPDEPPVAPASAFIDHDDAKRSERSIKLMQSRELPEDASREVVAETFRMWVHRHLRRKDFDTAFEPASTTAAARRGDCTEHGVLLCAMLRAKRIPARVAVGLIYVPELGGAKNVFGWHMWTQAWIDGRWVDLDATLRTPFDATHILFSVSDLATANPAVDFGRLISAMGDVRIEVIEPRSTTKP